MITVVIPARDAEATLEDTLKGLAEQDFDRPFEVVVVDNGSLDNTADVAERSLIVTRVVRRVRGDGPGSARNVGAAATRSPAIAFLDADCRPGRGWLSAGLNALEDADLVQGKVMPDPAAWMGPFDRTLSVGQANGLFESASLFVRRKVFESLGGFPDGLERGRSRHGRSSAPFGEDVLFGWRARRAGARTGFCDDALVYHSVTSRLPKEFVAERTRLAMFPALAVSVPELRDSFFYRRVFLSKRSASFDLGVAGAAVALVASEPLALLAATPYLVAVASEARPWGARLAPLVAATEAVADAVGAVALLRGSLRARSLVL